MHSIKFLFIVLVTLVLITDKSYSQINNPYEKEWKKVDDLSNKDLPGSAFVLVKLIYNKAKKERQDAQIIKSLIYMAGLQSEVREDNEIKSILEIEKEVLLNKEPATSILKSLLAGLYWQYFEDHRYLLYERTNTVHYNKTDIATWNTEDLHRKISSLYLQSISNEPLLKNTSLDPYDAIIIKGNVRKLRPVLYDLLAHRALDYFKNDEIYIKKPSYAFEINQPEAFAQASEFIQHKFYTKDSLSFHHKALLIYQNLIAFHLKDHNPDALIDVDMDRIEFVHQNSVLENREDLYKRALEQITNKYPVNPVAAQAWYLLAAFYNSQASGYNALKDTLHRFDKIKAKEILEKVIKDSSFKTEGWTNSYNLLKEINQKQFSFETEKVNIPGQPFRILVKYKNIPALNFRLIPADENLKKLVQTNEEEYWKILLKAKFIKTWQQDLPATNDLQQHATEIKIDALPVGEYFLFASPSALFEKKNDPLAADLFSVSNISSINRGNDFFILNRETGQPLPDAKVKIIEQQYDYNTSKYIKKNIGTFKTDLNGFFRIDEQKGKGNNSYGIEVSYIDDHLTINEITPSYHDYYFNRDNNKIEQVKKIFFFTDRSIYRPGQTVYFKGIVVTKDQRNNTVAPDYSTKIYLRNANYQLVDSMQLTTNEFGSFNGKFQLPQIGLNGQFQINDISNYNTVSFSVEEYKRPKFHVEFEKVKKSYKVEETITIQGNAKAYAGNAIGGAKMTYRVVRQSRLLYTWLGKYWPPYSELSMEIAHGETNTDKDGNFSFQFVAIPDKKIDRKLDPVFDYQIYTDITDMNGETRSGNSLVSAGYKSLLLSVSIPEKMAVDSFRSVSIKTENMNGEYLPSDIKVIINRLIPETRLIKSRYWQQPDQFILSKQEFIQYFPHDEYENETEYQSWPTGAMVYSANDSTKINGELIIKNKQLEAGYYKLQVSTFDIEGNEVKDIKYIELYDARSNNTISPEYLWTNGNDQSVKPGEKTNIQIGSSANVFLIRQVMKPAQKENKYSFTQLKNGKRTDEYTASEEDRGGYGVNYFLVRDNRFYQSANVINVPWSNKELSMEYVTFRDKTEPGNEEKWKMKITGEKNEKVAAEMLASMYDASLDQFKDHNWNKPKLWEMYYENLFWNYTYNFSQNESIEKNTGEANDYFNKKIYDELAFEMDQFQIIKKPKGIKNQYLRGPGPISRSMGLNMSGRPENADTAKFTNPKVVKDVVIQISAKSNSEDKQNKPQSGALLIRKNFSETAFFFPELKTDSTGIIEFSFTAPEALTRWKLQTLAHTKDLAFGLSEKEIVTQKKLMVQPNMPRFLRQGDQIELISSIVNLSDSEITGQVQLQLLDAATNQSVDGWFLNTFPNQYFTVAPHQTEVVKFPVQIPYQFSNALTWRIIASTIPAKQGSDILSDGEENVLPVLSNKILVTESMPIPMRGTGTKNFSFEKLLKSGSSESLQNKSLTVEYTSNPAWYAIQSLPYLMEYPYECAEQTWNRYYANALASMIINSSPRIKQIFEQWKLDTTALLSNLQKNQELKSALLEETPWVLEAKSEEQQKKNMALLFDLVRMSKEMENNLEKLKQMQAPNGGFVWFTGGPDDRYITQYILTAIGHLKNLKVYKQKEQGLQAIINTAVPYLDKKIKEDYDHFIKSKINLSKQNISYSEIQYLYMRSYFPEFSIPKASLPAYNYFRKQAQLFWTKQNKYMQGMIALALNRTRDKQTPASILKSLKETSIFNEEMGMYWKDNHFGNSWFWWSSPIETQSLLIEVFSEIANDTKTVDDLRIWLIKNKQANSWPTTKATADACYALLIKGTNWLSNEPLVQIKMGSLNINSTNQETEAGTGYFKTTIEGQLVKPEMGTISVTVQQPGNISPVPSSGSISWGSVYWQYFEDMNKISSSSTPLQLSKKLFIEKNTDKGQVLIPVGEGNELHVGDKLKVRIELRADRDMEYVHMKDTRASALEPVNVLSGYKWQGGLGYYESTKDASTNFFFNYLPKGTYVFEYPLFITHTGNFSNGITTIQCMYAPEFNAHSEGTGITVE